MSDNEQRWIDMVAAELVRARQHNAYNSAHEAYAVLLEEVMKKRQNRDRANMLKELVQIAAIAQKAAETLGLMTHDTGDSR